MAVYRTGMRAHKVFVNRFDGAVGKYINHTGNTDDQNGEQWAVLLIKNANLTPDTRKAVTFQLTTRAVVPFDDKCRKNMMINLKELNVVLEVLKDVKNKEDNEEIKNVINERSNLYG